MAYLQTTKAVVSQPSILSKSRSKKKNQSQNKRYKCFLFTLQGPGAGQTEAITHPIGFPIVISLAGTS